MELLYLYIREYKNVFKEKGINFSVNYSVCFENGNLIIEDNKSSIKKYYGKEIENVVMFLGENGAGKSTLLDILGMNREDRIEDCYPVVNGFRGSLHSYFILYHLYDDYYAFEFVDDTFLKGNSKINNIDMGTVNVENALYKLPMGCVFELNDNVFRYCDNIIYNWRSRNDITNKLEYVYITSDKYNYRINDKYRNSYEQYMFERKYCVEENSYRHLYEYFIILNALDGEAFNEKYIQVKNTITIDIDNYYREKDVAEFLHAKKKELDKLLGIKGRYQFARERHDAEKENENIKEVFLKTFYAEAIEYYFLECFVGWYESGNRKIDLSAPTPLVESVEMCIESFDDDYKMEILQGDMGIVNFQEEYGYLLYQIKNNSNAQGINYSKILEYVLSRVEVAAREFVDLYDRDGILQIIETLHKLSEEYFVDKRLIRIPCDTENIDQYVVEFLNIYDYCFKVRNDDNRSNSIYRVLNVSLSNMSEGQRIILDIVSKCVNAIYSLMPGDSIVIIIDEPDRALHPERARKFLDILLNAINKCNERKIQIVLSSHSPFVVTDILPENVYSIEFENGIREIVNSKPTYATNIYYLLMDSFMLKNTFGEHSYQQIKAIIETLKREENIPAEELKFIKNIIDRVGEKTVKNKLLELYQSHDDIRGKLAKQLLELDDDEKLKEIKRILE